MAATSEMPTKFGPKRMVTQFGSEIQIQSLPALELANSKPKTMPSTVTPPSLDMSKKSLYPMQKSQSINYVISQINRILCPGNRICGFTKMR